MLPKTTLVSQDDTHRLIPNKFCSENEGESVLSRLGLPPAQMEHLFQLDDATNSRLAGEANLLPGITVHELSPEFPTITLLTVLLMRGPGRQPPFPADPTGGPGMRVSL